ncbi:hypothetical protein DPMN_193074 [Dreissena polymorpha]|uniref:Uncharacterized protein n=1 Tax=Dreissena polymorpha TaxID=45954 RepID=A0A9D3Y2S8_DREPO|nr:hypothetical protein DPMN_193074 [Dreissena polymorpha]
MPMDLMEAGPHLQKKGWLQIKCPEAVTIWRVALKARAIDGKNITEWDFSGSNDGKTFTVLVTTESKDENTFTPTSATEL